MKAEGKEFDEEKVKRYLDLLVEAKKPAGRPGGKDFRAFLKTQKKAAATSDVEVIIKE